MSSKKIEEFWAWFDEKRNGLSVRQIEKRGGAPYGRISNVYKKKEPSAFVCETIAKGLEVDVVEVFRRAGLLKIKPGQMMPLLEPPIDDEVDLAAGIGELIILIKQLLDLYQDKNIQQRFQEVVSTGWDDLVERTVLQEINELLRRLPPSEQVEVLNYSKFRYSQYHEKNETENPES